MPPLPRLNPSSSKAPPARCQRCTSPPRPARATKRATTSTATGSSSQAPSPPASGATESPRPRHNLSQPGARRQRPEDPRQGSPPHKTQLHRPVHPRQGSPPYKAQNIVRRIPGKAHRRTRRSNIVWHIPGKARLRARRSHIVRYVPGKARRRARRSHIVRCIACAARRDAARGGTVRCIPGAARRNGTRRGRVGARRGRDCAKPACANRGCVHGRRSDAARIRRTRRRGCRGSALLCRGGGLPGQRRAQPSLAAALPCRHDAGHRRRGDGGKSRPLPPATALQQPRPPDQPRHHQRRASRAPARPAWRPGRGRHRANAAKRAGRRPRVVDTTDRPAQARQLPARTASLLQYERPAKQRQLRRRRRRQRRAQLRGGAWHAPAASSASDQASAPRHLQLVEKFKSPQLGNERTLRIYLPPSYGSDTKRRYPVLYMHDGQNLFDAKTAAYGTEWNIDEVADRLVRQGDMEEVIVVASTTPATVLANTRPAATPSTAAES